MRIPQLEYPIQNTYTIPYLPHAFYLGSFLVICLLVILNVALVGSDVVSTLVSDPNVVERLWWMPNFWPDGLRPPIGSGCQPVSLIDAQTLHTNSSVSLFSYVFRRANIVSEDEDPTKQKHPVPYMANPLECAIQSIIWSLEPMSGRMSFKSGIFCKLGGRKQLSFEVPQNITMSMQYSRGTPASNIEDDMSKFLTYSIYSTSAQRGLEVSTNGGSTPYAGLPADATSANNVLAVLDGLQQDLFNAVATETKIRQMNNVFIHNRYDVEWIPGVAGTCYQLSDATSISPAYSKPCADLGIRDQGRVIGASGWSGGAGDGYDLYPEFLAPFGATSTNLLIALRDAIRIDLGDLDPSSNIYLNKTYFDEVIEVDPYREVAAPLLTNTDSTFRLSYDAYWSSCTPWGCINGTWAQKLTSMPVDAPDGVIVLPYRPTTRTASVLNLSYLCPTLRRKSIASLLMSVFVSTVTMYNFLCAVFGFIMPKVEARYQKRGKNRKKLSVTSTRISHKRRFLPWRKAKNNPNPLTTRVSLYGLDGDTSTQSLNPNKEKPMS